MPEDQESEVSRFWEATQDPRKILGSGRGLGLRPRFKEVPLRGSDGRCCFMDAGDPQGEAGPGEGGKLQKAPKISGMPQAVRAKGRFTELQGLSPRKGSLPKTCGRISVPSQQDS